MRFKNGSRKLLMKLQSELALVNLVYHVFMLKKRIGDPVSRLSCQNDEEQRGGLHNCFTQKPFS